MPATFPGNRKVLLRSILLIVAVIGSGLGIARFLYAMREEPPRRELVSPALLVESVVVQTEEVVDRFAGYGTARPDRAANLSAEVSAAVLERVNGIEAGSVVHEGQLLIRLDDREYHHALERAQALASADQAAGDELVAEASTLEKLINTSETELRVARDERDRLAGLFEQGLAAKKEYDFANLAYQQARRVRQGYQMELAKNAPRQARFAASKRSHEADARLAELKIERCRIIAPFSGTIESLTVDGGDSVVPGSALLRIIDPTHVEVPIQLPASVYDRAKVGAACRVESESMRGVVWHGEVARIAVSADENTRTFPVYVDVDNTKQALPLLPGTFVRAAVRGRVLRDRILIPRCAIRDGHVFVVEQGVVGRRSVSVERFIEDRAVVEDGVRSGDRVILSHLDRLSAGTVVRTPAAEPTSSHADRSSSQSSVDSSP